MDRVFTVSRQKNNIFQEKWNLELNLQRILHLYFWAFYIILRILYHRADLLSLVLARSSLEFAFSHTQFVHILKAFALVSSVQRVFADKCLVVRCGLQGSSMVPGGGVWSTSPFSTTGVTVSILHRVMISILHRGHVVSTLIRGELEPTLSLHCFLLLSCICVFHGVTVSILHMGSCGLNFDQGGSRTHSVSALLQSEA